MSHGMSLRNAGTRRSAHVKPKPSLLANSFGVHSSELGEKRLNIEQIYALETMFQSNAAVRAARTVLSGQLLSGGISLKKDGEDVELTPEFKSHLADVWIPFAGDVLDSFLKWGLCVVSIEELEPDTRRAVLLAKRRKLQNPAIQPTKGKGSRAAKAAAEAAAPPVAPILVPMVPTLGSYEVAYVQGGRMGYVREYLVYSNQPGQGTKEDEEARVLVHSHPDSVGNLNSALSSVFDLGSFVGALTELAITAEASRSRPRMVTQLRKKDAAALDPGNLFFDSESRAVQAGADTEESTAAAKALNMQHELCKIINRLQSRVQEPDQDLHSFGGQGKIAQGKRAYAPPEVPASIFTLPKDHELAPNLGSAESRGDLEALTRMAIEQFAAAFGVPADLLFSGRFAGKSTSQLSLLNTTVSMLAKSINQVLSLCYRDVYGSDGEDVGQLQLLTAPLAASEEVLALYAGGLIPVELALPSVLHALGTPKEAIDAALEDAMKLQEEKRACECEEREWQKQDHEINAKEREAEVKHKEKETSLMTARPSPASSSK